MVHLAILQVRLILVYMRMYIALVIKAHATVVFSRHILIIISVFTICITLQVQCYKSKHY